jgi:GTP-binding protein
VVLTGDPGLSTLLDTHHRKHYRAQRGAHGKGARKDGRSGEDVVIRVPLGTLVRDDETGELLCEILRPDEPWVAARGGAGGRGNARFATPTRRAPTHAEPGQPGQEQWLRLELKVLADVGLVGFPNAGKSTLISRVSAARPRIASYPFTTLAPHLGMVEVDDSRFVVADIPGLVPGAHAGAGLGHRFLRHVERTRVLVHLLDPVPTLQGEPGRGPGEDYRAIRAELEAFAPELAERRERVFISKADLVPDADDRRQLSRPLEEIGVEPPRWLSAASGEGVGELLRILAADVAKR